MTINNQRPVGLLDSEAAAITTPRRHLVQGGTLPAAHSLLAPMPALINEDAFHPSLIVLTDKECQEYADRVYKADSLDVLIDLLDEMAALNINLVSSDNRRVFSSATQCTLLKRIRDTPDLLENVRESAAKFGLTSPYSRQFTRTIGIRVQILSLLTGLSYESFVI